MSNLLKAGIAVPLAALFLLIAGCTTTPPGADSSTSIDGESLRIGLLADTQITTPEQTSGYLFRTMKADAIANVAVRTAAQERLAPEHLGYMLKDIIAARPDVLLYLGDGANSGCTDELGIFFTELETARDQGGIPIFYVIGNHDYLATGNQASSDQRKLACGGKAYATKADLVARAAAFNRDSWERFAKPAGIVTGYSDSLATVTATAGRGCNAEERSQHASGCFYAAVLPFTKRGRSGELILVDTSDYRDLGVNPSLPVGSAAEFRGLRGGVSYKANGQNDWILRNVKANGAIAHRFLASHYPTWDLNWKNLPSGRIGDLLASGATNVWLSGHTHEKNPEQSIVRGLSYRDLLDWGRSSPKYDEVNVGSTTDSQAHGAIVEVVAGKAEKVAVSALSTAAQSECANWLSTIQFDDGYEFPMPQVADTHVRLGLTADYRRDTYNVSAAKHNVERLLSKSTDPTARERAVRCLMDAAAEAELRAQSWY